MKKKLGRREWYPSTLSRFLIKKNNEKKNIELLSSLK